MTQDLKKNYLINTEAYSSKFTENCIYQEK